MLNTRVTSGLHRLPRESRDTLFLLAVLAWVMAPLTLELRPWTGVLAAALLGWRAWLAWRSAPLPGRAVRVLALVLAVAAVFASFRTLVGYEAGITLAMLLLALKTLELRARRDAMVIFFLGFFVLLMNFLYSQALPVAVMATVGLFGLLTALVQAHMPVGRPPLALAARTALRLMVFGTPVMAALFLFFPRVAPLWGVPGDTARARTGLSEDMRVGSIASLAQDGTQVMRIRFLGLPAGAAPPQETLYFRGPVLSRFDGREWAPATERIGGRYPPRFSPQPQVEVRGQPLRYEATLEPSGRHWLLVMDLATARPEGADSFQSADLEWVSPRPLTNLLRYRAASYTDYLAGVRLSPSVRAEYTRLPDGFDPRTRALAAELRALPAVVGEGTPALVDAALARLRNGGYRYTLEPGVYGRDTADDFWFERKAGFCEHIASAFAVLMRAAGVPARIVTGYQGGAPNSVDGVWTVRQSDAHAWTEVWMADQGWVRVDPTASVAPERLSQFRADAAQGAFGQAFGAVVGMDFGGRIRAAWEAVNDRWNQWVLNYTEDRQLDLLRALGFDAPDWRSMARMLAGLFIAGLLAAIIWQTLRERRRDPWLRLYGRARDRLARRGLVSSEAVPPRALARMALTRFGAPAQPVAEWLLRLEAQRYASAAHASAALPSLKRQMRELRWPEPVAEAPPLP
ncbi:DUF3488 and transglutaminase-like domain-containing protein [Xylophilus sp. GOD-11R]|uniref:transglutaminase family protein n=1 Tax=Xylophilus sp. GOD-11R TaxID=3089814 RepID=UPI00298BEC08|nr:DUF3488 and transglutaminase-like domain-containing protein [Xylophilus sp. GOD-11R]WPB59102.1 DUF3488 and transglutaminase-like domain-containing protein [Xylophilus sp. GOD-11R]